MLLFLVTNLAKPLAPGCGLAWFCFLQVGRWCQATTILFPTPGAFCAETHHHRRGWMLGQHGNPEVPSPQQSLRGSMSCQGTSSTLHISRCTSRHEASGTSLPVLLIYEIPAVVKDYFSSSPSWCNVGVSPAQMRLYRARRLTTDESFMKISSFFFVNKLTGYGPTKLLSSSSSFPQPPPVSVWGMPQGQQLYYPWTHSSFHPWRQRHPVAPSRPLQETSLVIEVLETEATWSLYKHLYVGRNKEFYWFKNALFVGGGGN